MSNLALVALGGAIGASLRYLAGELALRLAGSPVVWVTAAVNVSGSLAMGMVFAWLQSRSAFSPGLALFLMTGILGGYTTFSAFSLDAVLLWQRGGHGAAIAYIVLSVVLSLAGLVAGLWLGRVKWL